MSIPRTRRSDNATPGHPAKFDVRRRTEPQIPGFDTQNNTAQALAESNAVVSAIAREAKRLGFYDTDDSARSNILGILDAPRTAVLRYESLLREADEFAARALDASAAESWSEADTLDARAGYLRGEAHMVLRP